MQVIIRMLSGEIHTVKIEPPYTVNRFQQCIRQQLDIHDHVTIFDCDPSEDGSFTPQTIVPYPILVQSWFSFHLELIRPTVVYEPPDYEHRLIALLRHEQEQPLLCHAYELTVKIPPNHTLAIYRFVIFSHGDTYYSILFEYFDHLEITSNHKPHHLLSHMQSHTYACLNHYQPYAKDLETFLIDHFHPKMISFSTNLLLVRSRRYQIFPGNPPREFLLAFPKLLTYVNEDLMGH